MRSLIVAAGLVFAMDSAALAQTPILPQQAPNMPAAKDVPAEKVAPSEPAQTGSTLSDKLQRSDGVIRPPETGGPDMRVPAPVPQPGTTPVIPPAGSPGSRNPSADPR